MLSELKLFTRKLTLYIPIFNSIILKHQSVPRSKHNESPL